MPCLNAIQVFWAKGNVQPSQGTQCLHVVCKTRPTEELVWVGSTAATGLLVGLFFPEVKQARGVSDRRTLWLQSGPRLMSKFLARRSRTELTASQVSPTREEMVAKQSAHFWAWSPDGRICSFQKGCWSHHGEVATITRWRGQPNNAFTGMIINKTFFTGVQSVRLNMAEDIFLVLSLALRWTSLSGPLANTNPFNSYSCRGMNQCSNICVDTLVGDTPQWTPCAKPCTTLQV